MKDKVDALLPGVRADLERLVRIPSVSAPGFDPAHVRTSAETTQQLFENEGLTTELLEIDGAHPAVFASRPAEGRPTVLLYAHHDVQPPGDEALWTSPPYEPAERDGRLYGRGTADDKGGIAMHLAAVRAFGKKNPVDLKIFVEGEEEIGSVNLTKFLEKYGDKFRADAIVLADSGNWRVGEPAITTSLRGLVDAIVEVRTLDHAVHSGMYGGPIPDALTSLCRLLSTLHAKDGSVVVGKRASGKTARLEREEKELRTESGVLDGVQMIARGSLSTRIWSRPSVSVLGIDAPTVKESSNQLVPVARAKVSMRLAPGDDPEKAMDDLVAHLESNVGWGAQVKVERGASGRPFALAAKGPAFRAMRKAMTEAWDRAPVDIGMGGTIPFVAAFAEAYPEAALLLTGVVDPDARIHGENESVDLGELARACLAETLFLAKLGRSGKTGKTGQG